MKRMMTMMQGMLLVVLLALTASVRCNAPYRYLPIDCDDIYRHDNTSSSGAYTIFPGGPTTPLRVQCDMDTDGGRWTVFQRRLDGEVNFYRPWAHYKAGFGNVAGEYWLGLENILLLIMRKDNELRVDMEDWEGEKASASYSSFSIGSEEDGYRLHLGSFSGGAAGDGLAAQRNTNFTTYDKDQDLFETNCARHYLGGCWYNSCHLANFNGIYAPPDAVEYENAQIIWQTWKGWNHSLKSIALKIRSVNTCH